MEKLLSMAQSGRLVERKYAMAALCNASASSHLASLLKEPVLASRVKELERSLFSSVKELKFNSRLTARSTARRLQRRSALAADATASCSLDADGVSCSWRTNFSHCPKPIWVPSE